MDVKRDKSEAARQAFPVDWQRRLLGELGTCHRGVSYDPDADLADGDRVDTVRLLRSNNIRDGKIIVDDVQYVHERRVAEVQILQAGDVVVCMANGSRRLVGKAGVFHPDGGHRYTFGAFIGCFRSLPKSAAPAYTAFLFDTEGYRRHVDLLLSGSSINNLRPRDIEALEVRVPPTLAEQEAIAEILGDADALIEGLEQLIAKKRLLKQGVMQELLTGRRRLPGFGKAWRTFTFHDVFRRLNAKAFQILASDYMASGDFPVVDQGQKYVVGHTNRADKVFACPPSGVIVFGDHTCIVKFVDFDFAVGADGTQVLTTLPGHDGRFHAFQLQARPVTSTGYNRHFKHLLERKFRAPESLEEQKAISQVLFDLDNEIGSIERQLSKAVQVKQGMMQQLLTGRIRLA